MPHAKKTYLASSVNEKLTRGFYGFSGWCLSCWIISIRRVSTTPKNYPNKSWFIMVRTLSHNRYLLLISGVKTPPHSSLSISHSRPYIHGIHLPYQSLWGLHRRKCLPRHCQRSGLLRDNSHNLYYICRLARRWCFRCSWLFLQAKSLPRNRGCLPWCFH